MRLDSGFYDHKIFSFLEDEKSIDYIVATPMFHSIQKSIFAQKTWLEVTDGIEITEFDSNKGTVSGTFRFNAINDENNPLGGEILNFNQGVFYKIPVIGLTD